MEILYILWFWILPILGILVPLFGGIFWVFIVPSLAKMLTYHRFSNVSYHLVHDASGFAELVPTKEQLPENVERTKRGWHFLPRPSWKDKKQQKKEVSVAEKIALQKYILKGIGKPVWIDYAGKIVSMNAGALAATQQTKHNPGNYLSGLEKYVGDLPNKVVDTKTGKTLKLKKDLTNLFKEIKKHAESKTITLIDPSQITQAVETLYPPSVIDAIAVNREMKGMKRRGKELTPLILGGAIIIGLVVIGVALILVLGG